MDARRRVPRMDRLLADRRVAALPLGLARAAATEILAEIRTAFASGQEAGEEDAAERVVQRVAAWLEPSITPVWNATGVVIHTNLGRAPWHPDAVAAVAAVAGYAAVEMDLPSGARGGRAEGIVRWLKLLTGAEDALVVNNNAAAVLLALTALARGREVVVSRGELVEIGGAFRVPDVVAAGGALLREVGTTNRTRVSDYAAATTPETAVWLRVHRSNFRIEGFTETPPRRALAEAAHAHGLLCVDDLGSGLLLGDGEDVVRVAVEDGADLVCFSGDKLLGGPQAGIVVGRTEIVARLRAHPLMRALRVDKVTLAALEATLAVWGRGEFPPVATMLDTPAEVLRARSERFVTRLAAVGVVGTVVVVAGRAGGGAMPEMPLDGFGVRLVCDKVDAVTRRLRVGRPAVVARVADQALIFDVRTLPDHALDAVAARVADALAG